MAGNVLVESPNEAQIKTNVQGWHFIPVFCAPARACISLSGLARARTGTSGHVAQARERASERVTRWKARQLWYVLQSKAKHMKLALPYSSSMEVLPFAH